MPEAPEPLEANCDLCGTSMPEDHRHLLQLDERSIVCVCESCWALRSGDAEYVPTGSRVVWLEDLDLPDDLWARFQIPIGLAFFLRTAGRRGGLLPEPGRRHGVGARPGRLGRALREEPGGRRTWSPRPRR